VVAPAVAPAAAPAAFPASPPDRAAAVDKSVAKSAAKAEVARPAPAAPPPATSVQAPAANALGRVVEKESRRESGPAAESKAAQASSPIDLREALPRPAPALRKDAVTVDSLRDADAAARFQAPPAEAAKRSRQEAAGARQDAAGAAAPAMAPAKVLQAAPMPPPVSESREAIEADPARWIESIRRLRAAGLDKEAAAEIARFRSRYPDHRLPADLAPKQAN
jgi:hypothetical protein